MSMVFLAILIQIGRVVEMYWVCGEMENLSMQLVMKGIYIHIE